MRAPLQDLYIYYQVADSDAAALAVRVRAMQAGLGLGQLKRRPGSVDGRQTWMEIYGGVEAGFQATLNGAVLAAALSELTAGSRHTEVFIDLEPGGALPCA
ncbi:DUF4936 family protein [Massilia sp. PWRC2]|uniref:DUF4936 family protein n=1 Tax=Massilia sp. PWRC2 TaxID=2804626 RepID=UPI003CF73FA9